MPPAVSSVLDRVIRWLVVAVGLVMAGCGSGQVSWPLRPKSDPPAHPPDKAPVSIIAAGRHLAALSALKPPPGPPADRPSRSAGEAGLTRQAAKKSATQVRLVASEARDELKDLGLSESEDAGLVAADWQAGESAFSLGEWEEAEQAFYRLINRIRQLRAVARMARERDVSERALTADLAANHDNVDPGHAGAAALRDQADRGLDALLDRYVTLQHEPANQAGRTAVAAQIRRGAREGDPLCQIAALLYSRDDPALDEPPDTLARYQAEGWSRVLQRAGRGSRTAAFLAARCYQDGIGVERDMREAAEWYRRGAEQGSPLAQCNLALLLMTGRGVARDDTRAAALFRTAALQNDPLAQFNLGYLHMTGQGVARDDAEAVRWYRLAAEQGFAAAQRNLGGMLAVGRGVPRNDAEAAKWYRLAAEQGDAGAQCNIGWMCAHGVGMERNLVQAVSWYHRAAERGNSEAIFMLGVMTVEGAGTARDEALGRRWIAEAADRGLEQARAWLERAARRRDSNDPP
jgi:TPR repeat protein